MLFITWQGVQEAAVRQQEAAAGPSRQAEHDQELHETQLWASQWPEEQEEGSQCHLGISSFILIVFRGFGCRLCSPDISCYWGKITTFRRKYLFIWLKYFCSARGQSRVPAGGGVRARRVPADHRVHPHQLCHSAAQDSPRYLLTHGGCYLYNKARIPYSCEIFLFFSKFHYSSIYN